jgi:hypothetical protein
MSSKDVDIEGMEVHMSNIVKCSIIIYDDFNNVLIAERGKGKKVVKEWGIFGKSIKGKETEEKCILKAVDKDIKCTVFDLKPFKTYILNDQDEKLQVYTGTIKEYITCHKTINSVKWIGRRELDNYQFNQEEKQILKDFFSR